MVQSFRLCLPAFVVLSAIDTCRGFQSPKPARPSRHDQIFRFLKKSNSLEDNLEPMNQITDIVNGWNGVISGESLDRTKVQAYFSSAPDVVATLSLLPLVGEAFRTAFTGEFNSGSYVLCATSTALCAASHFALFISTPRDYRAPRLAEPRTVYEFSYLYLVAFAWLLLRINSEAIPPVVESADLPGTLFLTAITVYGVLYPVYAMSLFDKPGALMPSSEEFKSQAKLLCSGNIAINVLACLFLPFVGTLCLVRGTEWWDRVQILHPNQEAFFGVSLLVAIIGDIYGAGLLRVKELGIVTQYNSIVALGIVGNIILLLCPEIIFNSVYSSGVSELGFYQE